MTVFRALVGGQRLEGTDILRSDAEGRVREITVLIRPLPGLTVFTAALAPRLAGEVGKTRGVATAAMVRPLAAITRLGDGPASRMVQAWRASSQRSNP